MNLKVRVKVDPGHNEMYVRFLDLPPGALAYSVRVADTMNLDVDDKGRVVGIEVTDLQRAFGVRPHAFRVYGPLVGVKEAAALIGVNRPNFLRDYVSREDFPEPVADLASGRVWMLVDVMDYATDKHLRRKETVGYMVMLYMEANEMTVGTLGRELGLDYKGALRLLQNNECLDKATGESLAAQNCIDLDNAQGLLARIKAVRAVGRSAGQ